MTGHCSNKRFAKKYINIKFGALHVSLCYGHYLFLFDFLAPYFFLVLDRGTVDFDDLINYRLSVRPILCTKHILHLLYNLLGSLVVIVLKPRVECFSLGLSFGVEVSQPVVPKLFFFLLFVFWTQVMQGRLGIGFQLRVSFLNIKREHHITFTYVLFGICNEFFLHFNVRVVIFDILIGEKIFLFAFLAAPHDVHILYLSHEFICRVLFATF